MFRAHGKFPLCSSTLFRSSESTCPPKCQSDSLFANSVLKTFLVLHGLQHLKPLQKFELDTTAGCTPRFSCFWTTLVTPLSFFEFHWDCPKNTQREVMPAWFFKFEFWSINFFLTLQIVRQSRNFTPLCVGNNTLISQFNYLQLLGWRRTYFWFPATKISKKLDKLPANCKYRDVNSRAFFWYPTHGPWPLPHMPMRLLVQRYATSYSC